MEKIKKEIKIYIETNKTKTQPQTYGSVKEEGS